jgi:ferredoxin
VASIFTLINENAWHHGNTLRFPEQAKLVIEYRGVVRMDPSKCIACTICDYVCPSSAITATRYEDHMDWEYDISRCTFCGRCVRTCPGEALSQDAERPHAYSVPHADFHAIPFPTCTECGRPMPAFNEAMMQRAFGNVTDKLRERVQVCDRCRLLATQAMAKRKVVAQREKQEKAGES